MPALTLSLPLSVEVSFEYNWVLNNNCVHAENDWQCMVPLCWNERRSNVPFAAIENRSEYFPNSIRNWIEFLVGIIYLVSSKFHVSRFVHNLRHKNIYMPSDIVCIQFVIKYSFQEPFYSLIAYNLFSSIENVWNLNLIYLALQISEFNFETVCQKNPVVWTKRSVDIFILQ